MAKRNRKNSVQSTALLYIVVGVLFIIFRATLLNWLLTIVGALFIASGIIELVRGRGRKVGIALKPGTPAEAVMPYLAKVDMVLVMTVEPGFGGQAFMPDMCPKLTALRQAADKVNPGLLLQVDGGISDKTAPLCVEAGANVLVAGSYVFGHADPDGAVRLLAELH